MKLATKPPFLRIKVVDFIPYHREWSGCYCELTRTIYVERRPLWQMVIMFIHELIHWALHLFGATQDIQDNYEWAWDTLIGQPLFKLTLWYKTSINKNYYGGPTNRHIVYPVLRERKTCL